MAKRFTATEKWDDPWFFELSTEAKMFWLYLLDKCDHAGIWHVNMVIAEAYLGFKPSLDMVKDKIVVLSHSKWFIPKFINFQYGELSDTNRMHQSVIAVLKKEGAWKGLSHPLEGAKEQEQDKEKEKEKENNIGRSYFGEFVKLSTEEYQKLVKSMGKHTAQDYIDKVNEGIGSKGYKYKNHYYTVLAWWRKDGKKVNQKDTQERIKAEEDAKYQKMIEEAEEVTPEIVEENKRKFAEISAVIGK